MTWIFFGEINWGGFFVALNWLQTLFFNNQRKTCEGYYEFKKDNLQMRLFQSFQEKSYHLRFSIACSNFKFLKSPIFSQLEGE